MKELKVSPQSNTRNVDAAMAVQPDLAILLIKGVISWQKLRTRLIVSIQIYPSPAGDMDHLRALQTLKDHLSDYLDGPRSLSREPVSVMINRMPKKVSFVDYVQSGPLISVGGGSPDDNLFYRVMLTVFDEAFDGGAYDIYLSEGQFAMIFLKSETPIEFEFYGVSPYVEQ